MNEPIRLLNLEPEGYCEEARKILREFAHVEERALSPQELAHDICNYDGVILRLGYSIGAELLSRKGKLRVIGTPTTGLDHIDVEEARRQGIQVLCLRGETEFLDTVRATAEHTLALTLALMRRIPWAHASVLDGVWDRDLFRGHELAGKKFGILGLGRLGKLVASCVMALGMEVLAFDVREGISVPGVKMVSKESLFRQCHVISVHVPLGPETVGLVGSRELAWMRPDAFLINTSRGAILDEQALLSALENGRIAGAALDVLCEEPRLGKRWERLPPLVSYAREHKNLLLTPHLGGATHESMAKTEIFLAKKIRAYFQIPLENAAGGKT
ncbi:MAG: NAD(P)-dependent oxidoreductase [bacterium]